MTETTEHLSDLLPYPAIVGVGAAAPRHVVANKDILNELLIGFEGSPDEEAQIRHNWRKWTDNSGQRIKDRTGIEARRWRRGQQDAPNIVDLQVAAGEEALLSVPDLGYDTVRSVHVAAVERDGLVTPAIASLAVGRLGLGENTASCDYGAGCSGFVAALRSAMNSLIVEQAESPDEKMTALVGGADTLSHILDVRDPAVGLLFGDAAGMTALQRREGAKRPVFRFRTHSSLETLNITNGKAHMVGGAVARYVLQTVPPLIREVAQLAGLADKDGNIDWSEVGAVITHPGNRVLAGMVANEIGAPEKICVVDAVKRYGNTSAASIPVALMDGYRSGQVKPGMQRVIVAGMGAGMAAGAGVVSMDLPPLRPQRAAGNGPIYYL